MHENRQGIWQNEYHERLMQYCFLSKASRATTNGFTLANDFSTQLRAIQGKVDVEVDAVEGTLWGVHTLKIFLKILAAKI
jgi:hypothetical protein